MARKKKKDETLERIQKLEKRVFGQTEEEVEEKKKAAEKEESE